MIIYSLFSVGLIEGIHKEQADQVNVQLKTFYDSCMDVDSIRTKGFIPGKKHYFLFISASCRIFAKSESLYLLSTSSSWLALSCKLLVGKSSWVV